jgi:hypothetical protein
MALQGEARLFKVKRGPSGEVNKLKVRVVA